MEQTLLSLSPIPLLTLKLSVATYMKFDLHLFKHVRCIIEFYKCFQQSDGVVLQVVIKSQNIFICKLDVLVHSLHAQRVRSFYQKLILKKFC